ncbi:MAG: 1,6-anhydro-N-acetylmuramyl-L-alanine amidase AmpD [Methylococcaceae bacterium]|nr:1,6-anhydro-N-acetylmuramyl-L-alanine amidase AmpD [Methylococcaceae bacterium]
MNKINIATGWIESVNRIISPNCDDRPETATISLIVIHCISLPPGDFGGEWIDRLFTNSLPADAHPYFGAIHQLKVSAHVLIRRDGEIVQYVPFHKRAWHAGISCYRGKEKCNDFSIGIELEGTETLSYTDAQYECLSDVIAALLEQYRGLAPDAIASHSDIAPGRKTDPGESFDWARLHRLLESKAAPGSRV